MKKYLKLARGFSLLEVIVGTAIISVSLISLTAALHSAMTVMDEGTKSIQAAFLLDEGAEAIRTMRDTSWNTNIASLNSGSSYYLEFDGLSWQATTSNIYIDGVFERSFVLEDVYRDANDDIAGGGLLDLNTKKVSVFVSWRAKAATTTKSVFTYITNLLNN